MTIPLVSSLGGFSQVGLVVRDAEAAMRSFSDTLGVGPFFVMRGLAPEDFRFRGRPSEPPVLMLGFAQAGPVQIEIIQQLNDAPSAYTEFLAAGREGCQHLSVWLADREAYDGAHARLSAAGLVVVHETGPAVGARFAYFATDLPGGLMIEIAEAKTPASRELFDGFARAAQGWDGRDPIRELA